jgi:hypothetical protein
MMTLMSDAARRSRTTLIALVSGVVLVVVIALIAVFARGETTQLDAGTPEGVVQRYAQAVVDGDVPTALSHLVPDVADECERVPPLGDDVRVTLLETTERDDTARVRVLVVRVYDTGPLGADEFESEEVFDLVEVDGEWLIETAPWQLAVCFENG